MAVDRQVICWKDHFDRAQVMTTTAGDGGWAIKKTGAGTPTYTTVSGGGVALTLDNTSEAQIVTLYQKDILPLALLNVKRISFNAKVSGIDSVTTLVMGLASAQNDTSDTVSLNAWFRMQGSVSLTAVVTETDDNVTNNDDIATGATLAAVYKRFTIDFTRGLSDIRFYIDGAPVSTATTFAMGAIVSTDYVQPYVQIQKASGTGVPAVTLRDLEIEYSVAVGA